MSDGIISLGLADAFLKVSASYDLTEDESGFIFCVLLRLDSRLTKASRRMMKMLEFIPITDFEVDCAVGIMRAIDGPSGSMKREELLLGIDYQPRPNLVFEVLRRIASEVFPPRMAKLMAIVFS